MFLLVLLLAAGALCGVVYWVTNEEESEDYKTQVRATRWSERIREVKYS